MAKRDLSRNLPAKKYKHTNPTEVRLSFEFQGGSTQFIDIARALSIINRKFVSQQAYFYVNKVELYNNSDHYVNLLTLPDNWVTANSYRRARALFDQMNETVAPPSAAIAGAPYYDFKVFMSELHKTTGSSDPVLYSINDAGVPQTADEWRYSQLISADDDGDAVQQADNFYLHMLGDHAGTSANWTSVGIVKSYARSRSTVSTGASEVNVDLVSSDPLMNLFDYSSEEQINDIVSRLVFDNDSPPYDIDHYTGEDVEMAHQSRLVTTSSFGRVATAPGFCAPLGLICVDPANTIGSEDSFRIVVTLAQGTYHGVYAERV